MKQTRVILYAEDDPDDRELLSEAIKEKSIACELVETVNGREALLYLRSAVAMMNPPCLIMLDLNMPVLDGRETLAIIKSERDLQTIPVIIFTTSASPLDEDFCKRLSVEMITKPSSPEELGKVADKLVGYCSQCSK